MKKFFATVLTVIMILNVLPTSTFADYDESAETIKTESNEDYNKNSAEETVEEANVEPVEEASVEIAPVAPVAPVAPEVPDQPDVEGLSDEEANEKISAYNDQVDRYNEAVEQYNAELDSYKSSAAAYNQQVETFNQQAEDYNRQVEEHNRAEQEKLEAYEAEMEKYNKSLASYNNYEAAIARTAKAHSEKIASQMEVLGDIGRVDKESILKMGTVLEEEYVKNYGWREVAIGKPGDLVISWDDLLPNSTRSTITVESGADSDTRYKVANLHIFEDFVDFNDLADYQSENGWDCMNINVDDENGVIIIPKALIDRTAMIEIEVAEVGANDTVTVSGQNSVFQGTYATVAGRFLEGYTDGAYWLPTQTVFQSNASSSDTDWTGTSHTFSFADGTCDRSSIKNPLNVNYYMFQRYTNPYSIPEKPQEISVNMMDRAENKSTVEIIGESLQGLTRLALREILKVETPVIEEVPVVEETPVTKKTPAVANQPLAPAATPVLQSETVTDEPIPLAQAPMNVQHPKTETISEQPVPLVSYTAGTEIAVEDSQMAGWALVNLLASILTVLLALLMLVDKRADNRAVLLGLVAAIASVLVFLFTENLANPMVLVDRWTIAMLALLVVNAVTILTKRSREAEKEAA